MNDDLYRAMMSQKVADAWNERESTLDVINYGDRIENHRKVPRPAPDLLDERHQTHGSFSLNSQYGQSLRTLFRESPGWKDATPRTREALDYLAGKLSRILSGKPNEVQHWEDIAGYAELAATPDMQR